MIPIAVTFFAATTYIPSLDFSDARNSQYLVLLFDDLA
jgi:hypothetical protein